MDTRKTIQELLAELPDERVEEVLNFVRSLAQMNETEEWRAFGRQQFAKLYKNDDAEYSAGVVQSNRPTFAEILAPIHAYEKNLGGAQRPENGENSHGSPER